MSWVWRRIVGHTDSNPEMGDVGTSPPTPPTSKPPPHIVFATFQFHDADSKAKFLTVAESEEGLTKTRAFKGCRTIKCFESTEDDTLIVIYQEWDSQADHEAYFELRTNEGMIAALGELMPAPIDIRRFKTLDV